MLSLAFTYRDASIPELRQYLVFLTSPVGKRYYGAVAPAIGSGGKGSALSADSSWCTNCDEASVARTFVIM
jgi:hypothetical protein